MPTSGSLATSTAGSALSYHVPFHNSIFADIFLTYNSVILSSSPIPFFPADSLFFFMPSIGTQLQARPDMRPAATSRSTIHLLHISTILFSLSEIWTMTLSASTVEYHQRCCSPTNFFLSFIPATFRRPFNWYITGLYRLSAFGSSPKSCSCLRQPPQTTQMRKCHSPYIFMPPPQKKTPSPIFLLRRTNTQRTTRR